MKEVITKEDILKTIKDMLACNEGDEATENLLKSIGAIIFDITIEEFEEMI